MFACYGGHKDVVDKLLNGLSEAEQLEYVDLADKVQRLCLCLCVIIPFTFLFA